MKKNLLLTALLLAGATSLAGTMQASAEPLQASQAQGVITGTVVDEQGEPIIGASVVPVGRETMGVSTGVDGQFSLRVPAGTKLKVSFVGYDPVEVSASQGMTVRLSVTESLLDEIVVVGYGTQKKINMTGAVSTVDVNKQLDSRPVVDVAKALQGAVPGLTIQMANGDIGSSPQINIRGVGTLSNGHTSTPLIIVDGVPVDDMSYLNPDDIESISVLKDAASSAIYGARAAFGVILITTKQGQPTDRVRVNYSNNFGWGRATVLPEFNDNVTALNIAIHGNTNPGGDEEIFGMYYTDLLPYAELWAQQHGGKKYTSMVELKPWTSDSNVGDYKIMDNGQWIRYADWDVAKTVFSDAAFSQKHNISLEGQSGKTNYRLSFSYDDKEGLIKVKPDRIQRYTVSANVDTQIFSWLKAGARMNFAQRIYNDPGVSYNFYQYTWRWPGLFMGYGYTVDDETGEKTYFRNELAARIGAYEQSYTWSKTTMQAYFLANLTKDILLQGDFTYTINSRYSKEGKIPYYLWNTWTTTPFQKYSYYSATTDWAGNSAFKDTRWAANVYATFDKTFAEKHNLKVMLGWAADRQHYDYFYADRNELTDPNHVNVALATSSTSWTISGSAYNRATTGFFGRLNYNYNDIWLLEGNVRYDGSSLFPAKDQWAWFPSASAGYRFSQEEYFESLRNSWWNNGKIRFSYGQVGNQAIGSNMFLTTVSKGGNTAFLNASGNPYVYFNAPSSVSETLTWERLITYDLGVDLGFLHNELNFGFDWYIRDTKDMLAPGQTLPGVYGASTPYQNAGSLRTKGWEFSVQYNHRFGDVNVWANFMLSDAKTKITKWNNPTGIIYSYLPQSSSYTEGMYFGDIWGLETDRYFTVDDFTWDTADGKWVSGATMTGYANGVATQKPLESGNFIYGPGDVKFVDQNGDGKIDWGADTVDDHGDLVKIGNAMPRYQYSFRLGAEWKGFDIDLFFQGVGKQKVWGTGSTIVMMAQSGLGTFTNQTDYNKIEYDGKKLISQEVDQNNWYPRPYSGSGASARIPNVSYGAWNFYPQSKYLVNLAYLRLKNLTVGYTLPRKITQKALIQKARVYFSADNLCFLYAPARKYQLDPEMTTIAGSSVIGNNNSSVGTFGRTAPQQQVLSFGLQVTF